jgi:hypothetical protein
MESEQAPSDPSSGLCDLLIAVVPRERSGARMTARVEYQKHWALSEVLRRHQAGEPYCFVFEHHDDVIVLDDEHLPRTVAFYQVKTKNHGEWKLRELLKRDRPDEEGLSILGKMYVNRLTFGDHTASMTFVSNVPCMARLATGGVAGDRDMVCAVELAADEREQIIGKLRAEHGDQVSDGDAELIFLAHSDLALRNTEEHGVGKLDAFLRVLFPHRRLPTHAIYRTLLGEISRRTGHEDIPGSFAQLVRDRGLTRERVEECLREAGAYSNPEEAWAIVSAHLIGHGGWSPRAVQRVGEAWRKYEVERMDPENITLQRLAAALRGQLAGVTDSDGINVMLTSVLADARLAHPQDVTLLGDGYVQAMILFEYMSNVDSEFSSSSSSAAEEAS